MCDPISQTSIRLLYKFSVISHNRLSTNARPFTKARFSFWTFLLFPIDQTDNPRTIHWNVSYLVRSRLTGPRSSLENPRSPEKDRFVADFPIFQEIIASLIDVTTIYYSRQDRDRSRGNSDTSVFFP